MRLAAFRKRLYGLKNERRSVIKIDSKCGFAYNEDIRLRYFCLLVFQKKGN